MRLPLIPVTCVENYCASGTEAFRGAVYAVAAGAADIALAVGVEKLKDTGYGGLPQRTRGVVNDMMIANASAPGAFAQLASAYRLKHGVSATDLKRAMAQVSVKSHANAVKNPRATFAVRSTSRPSSRLLSLPSRLVCTIVAACQTERHAPSSRRQRSRGFGKQGIVAVKALQLSVSNGVEASHNSWDGSYFMTTRRAATKAYEEAGIRKPREEISMAEVHDCFSITELVTMEDLFISVEGNAWRDFLDGFYNSDGGLPCQIDGGLKCFGHPIGASGLRMLYEGYLQLRGRAEKRQLDTPKLVLTHNLGGFPHQNVASVSIIGRYEKNA